MPDCEGDVAVADLPIINAAILLGTKLPILT